jgi:hypothetical protein
MRMRTSTVLLYKIKQLPTPPRTHGRQITFVCAAALARCYCLDWRGQVRQERLKKIILF